MPFTLSRTRREDVLRKSQTLATAPARTLEDQGRDTRSGSAIRALPLIRLALRAAMDAVNDLPAGTGL
jgi:hypothetical protein